MPFKALLEVVPPGSDEAALVRQLDPGRLPAHVAIIMDGNGRWAAQRHLPRVEGHRAGIESVRDTVETGARLGLKVLTLYAFSIENWKRPASEVSTSRADTGSLPSSGQEKRRNNRPSSGDRLRISRSRALRHRWWSSNRTNPKAA